MGGGGGGGVQRQWYSFREHVPQLGINQFIFSGDTQVQQMLLLARKGLNMHIYMAF